MGAILSAIVALAGIAGAGAGIYAATRGSEKPELPKLPSAPSPEVAEETARKEEMRRRARMTKTLLTSPQGTLGGPDTEKKVLLGA